MTSPPNLSLHVIQSTDPSPGLATISKFPASLASRFLQTPTKPDASGNLRSSARLSGIPLKFYQKTVAEIPAFFILARLLARRIYNDEYEKFVGTNSNQFSEPVSIEAGLSPIS